MLFVKKILSKKLNSNTVTGCMHFITTETGEKHKIDFGQYPFGPIEKLKNFNGLLVEGLLILPLIRLRLLLLGRV